jgi:hypothetical protein
MAKPVKLSGNDGKNFTITIDQFGKGVMTLFDDTRLPIDGVHQAQNMMLDQDGVWTTRPGTSSYGGTFDGTVDGGGSFTTYNSDNTASTYYWIVDNGFFKIAQDGEDYTTVSGVTWTPGWPTAGKQVSSLKNDNVRSNLLLLTNGYDPMAYYDIGSGTLGTYSSISTPTGLVATRNTLTAGNYNVFYKVTAVNSIGETLASSEASVSGGVNKTRDNWDVTSTETVSLDWNDVTDATRYNIYYSDRSNEEVFLDSVAVSQYTDTGEATPNPYQATPDSNSTSGPKYMDIALSGNRIWGTKDPNLPYRVGWTGTGQYMGAFNPFYGGGYVDLEKGGVERPEKVVHFRDGKGNALATVLSSDPNGAGATWAISLTTLTVDTLVIVIPVVAKQQGSVGTRSPRGVIEYNDAVFFPSPRGFHNTGSKQSILNVLVTTELSDSIRPTINGINNAYANNICGIAHNGRLYWSVPYGASENNIIIVHDAERKGAWALPWTIGVKQFFEYTDTAGAIHLLAIPVDGDTLIEFGSSNSGDSGEAFSTVLESGLIHWDKNHMTWAYVQKAYVELANPHGSINFSVAGTQKGKNFSTIGSRRISAALGESGFGNDLFGNIQFGDSTDSTATFSQPSTKKVLNIKKYLNNIRWNLSTDDINSRFTLMQVVIEGVVLPTSDPSSWKT